MRPVATVRLLCRAPPAREADARFVATKSAQGSLKGRQGAFNGPRVDWRAYCVNTQGTGSDRPHRRAIGAGGSRSVLIAKARSTFFWRGCAQRLVLAAPKSTVEGNTHDCAAV